MNIISPVKRRVDVISIPADFSDALPAGAVIVDVLVTMTLWAGQDNNPSSMLYEGPIIHGRVVSQRVAQGIPGNIYTIEFLIIDDSDNKYTMVSRIAVIPDGVPGEDIFTSFYRTSLVYPLESIDGIDTPISLGDARLYSTGVDGIDAGLSINSAFLIATLISYTLADDAVDTGLTIESASLDEVLISYTESVDAIDTALSIVSAVLTSYATIEYTTGRPEGVNCSLSINSASLYVP